MMTTDFTQNEKLAIISALFNIMICDDSNRSRKTDFLSCACMSIMIWPNEASKACDIKLSTSCVILKGMSADKKSFFADMVNEITSGGWWTLSVKEKETINYVSSLTGIKFM